MNVLAIGDVVGSAGCAFVRQHLPSLKKLKNIDIVIANGENSADSNGITPESAQHLFDSGVDIITTGNHVFRRREIYSYLDETEHIARPANFPSSCNGRGVVFYDKGSYRLVVINLLGTVYMENLASPFETADRILSELSDRDIVLVDIHAEATSEKKALAYYLDGRVAGMFGTHTHVQTADEQILPKKTGYITDLGMTGPIHSVLGVKSQQIIDKFLTKMPSRFEVAPGDCQLSGVIFSIDQKLGQTVSMERVLIV